MKFITWHQLMGKWICPGVIRLQKHAGIQDKHLQRKLLFRIYASVLN
jgi:hypothetical protein